MKYRDTVVTGVIMLLIGIVGGKITSDVKVVELSKNYATLSTSVVAIETILDFVNLPEMKQDIAENRQAIAVEAKPIGSIAMIKEKCGG